MHTTPEFWEFQKLGTGSLTNFLSEKIRARWRKSAARPRGLLQATRSRPSAFTALRARLRPVRRLIGREELVLNVITGVPRGEPGDEPLKLLLLPERERNPACHVWSAILKSSQCSEKNQSQNHPRRAHRRVWSCSSNRHLLATPAALSRKSFFTRRVDGYAFGLLMGARLAGRR